jgi:hypothetical protein
MRTVLKTEADSPLGRLFQQIEEMVSPPVPDPIPEIPEDALQEKPQMSDCSPSNSQQCAELNMLNAKLAYDSAAQLQNQSLADNQQNSRAWDEINLAAARDSQKIKYTADVDAATIKHLAQLNILASAQTGQTENQQTVSPVRTATGDAIVGGVGVSAEQIAANVANLATSLTPVIVGALATAVAQTIAALVPTVVSAGATGAQTAQPKA